MLFAVFGQNQVCSSFLGLVTPVLKTAFLCPHPVLLYSGPSSERSVVFGLATYISVISFYELRCFCLHGKATEEPHQTGPVWDRETWPLGLSSVLMVAVFITAVGNAELGIMGDTAKGLWSQIVCVLDSQLQSLSSWPNLHVALLSYLRSEIGRNTSYTGCWEA